MAGRWRGRRLDELISNHDYSKTFYKTPFPSETANHWLFAAVPLTRLMPLAPRLDLMIMRQNGSITHNLRTIVLDPQGRIHRLLDGNTWTPQQLADDLLEAACKP